MPELKQDVKKETFWSRIVKDNRQFDITFSIVAMFLIFAFAVGAAIVNIFQDNKINSNVMELIKELDDIIKMLITFLVTKYHMNRVINDENKDAS